MQRGSLVIYDQNGKPWHNTGDAEGDILPHETPKGLPFVILPFGALAGVNTFLINPVTKELEILELYEQEMSLEELQAENEALKLELLTAEGVI